MRLTPSQIKFLNDAISEKRAQLGVMTRAQLCAELELHEVEFDEAAASAGARPCLDFVDLSSSDVVAVREYTANEAQKIREYVKTATRFADLPEKIFEARRFAPMFLRQHRYFFAPNEVDELLREAERILSDVAKARKPALEFAKAVERFLESDAYLSPESVRCEFRQRFDSISITRAIEELIADARRKKIKV